MKTIKINDEIYYQLKELQIKYQKAGMTGMTISETIAHELICAERYKEAYGK